MLSIINLHATDMNALYSLLSFIPDQSKNLHVVNPPTVTFDQPLYVKAVEIALSMNADIIVCLVGFYQLMSFVDVQWKVVGYKMPLEPCMIN